MDSSVNVRKEDQVKVLGILSKMLNNNESINLSHESRVENRPAKSAEKKNRINLYLK